MTKIALIILVFSLFSCSNKDASTEEITRNLEYSIDSIYNLSNGSEQTELLLNPILDSLLKLDSENYKALKTRGLISFNHRNPHESVQYLRRAVQVNPNDNMSHVILGWSYERIGQLDSSHICFNRALEFDRSEWKVLWMLPQLTTVIHGKQAGLDSLYQVQNEISTASYFHIKNDINSYEDNGLSSLFFPPFFNLSDTNNFYINIPENLYTSGVIDSRNEVETLFAKLGVNISVSASYSADRGYKIFTTKKYLEALESIDTLGIKKL